MKKAAKWILGIVIGLVVLAVLAAAGFFAFNHWGSVGRMASNRQFQEWGGAPRFGQGIAPDQMPRGRMPRGNMPMYGMGGRYMGYRPFRPLGALVGGLFCLGLFTLVVLGIIVLVRSLSHKPQPAPVTSVPAVAVAAPAVVAPAAVEPVVSEAVTRPCPNCGRPMQADWSQCPYDGTALS
jgi:hypothetical protein